MNPQRYLMPVIIAAGLHGALVYFFSDHNLPPPRPPKEKPAVQKDFPPLELTAERAEMPAGGDTAGAPPLPDIPDSPREPKKEDILFVPVKASYTLVAPVAPLLKIPETGVDAGGPGDGNNLRNGPRAVLEGKFLDRVPRATVRPAPVYPGNMRSTDGSVTVEFVVDTAGRVVTAEAVRWTHRNFVDPAVRAVLLWRFEPGTINGRKVNFRMAIPIEFHAME